MEAGFETVGELYNACKFRAALGEALALVREANGDTFAALSAGLDHKATWFQIALDSKCGYNVYGLVQLWILWRRRAT